MTIPKEFLEQSRQDAIEDCEELLWLMDDIREKLSRFNRILKQEKSFIPLFAQNEHAVHARQFDESIQRGVNEISYLKKILVAQKEPSDLLAAVSQKKQEWGIYIHSIQGIIGSLMVSFDWQSPSYDASVAPQAGSQRGRIEATINDYKRDHHLDAYPYERAFVREYIDAAFKPFVHLYATASGMAAFTTVLNFLIMEKKINGPVIMGKGVYFENKELVEKSFAPNVIEVDESDTDTVCKQILQYSPRILFFDTLANSETMCRPNLEAIMDFLAAQKHSDTYMVIDNTCASVFFQPLEKYIRKPRNLTFFIVESLNKFYQFGMDRVTGGVVWGYGKEAGKLFEYRMHLGVNIPDASIHSLVAPDRNHLTRRLIRLGRNSMILAQELADFISHTSNRVIEQIIYPGLFEHPSYQWAYDLSFHGSFFVPMFQKKHRSVRFYKKFISRAIQYAGKEKVSILAGTSFGFSATRVYLTALRATAANPFVRISSGTEQRWEVEKIAEVFKKAIASL